MKFLLILLFLLITTIILSLITTIVIIEPSTNKGFLKCFESNFISIWKYIFLVVKKVFKLLFGYLEVKLEERKSSLQMLQQTNLPPISESDIKLIELILSSFFKYAEYHSCHTGKPLYDYTLLWIVQVSKEGDVNIPIITARITKALSRNWSCPVDIKVVNEYEDTITIYIRRK